MIKYVNIRIMPKMSQKEKYCVILLLCGTKSSQITEADSRGWLPAAGGQRNELAEFQD